MTSRISRRAVLATLGAAFAAPRRASAQAAVVRVGLAFPRGQYFFDPTGIWMPKGGTVRWEFAFSGGVGALMGVTVTAFHPDPRDVVVRPYPYGEVR